MVDHQEPAHATDQELGDQSSEEVVPLSGYTALLITLATPMAWLIGVPALDVLVTRYYIGIHPDSPLVYIVWGIGIVMIPLVGALWGVGALDAINTYGHRSGIWAARLAIPLGIIFTIVSLIMLVVIIVT